MVLHVRRARVVAQHDAQAPARDVHTGDQAVVARERDELRAPPVVHGAVRLELAFVGQLVHERGDRGGGDAHDLGELHLCHRAELMDRFQ